MLSEYVRVIVFLDRKLQYVRTYVRRKITVHRRRARRRDKFVSGCVGKDAQ